MTHLVRTFRIQRGWTIPELAKRATVTERCVYKIEDNQSCNIKKETMVKIAGAFELPTSVIFFPEEEMGKRRIMAGIFRHTIAVLRERGALNEEALLNTPPPPDRVVVSSSSSA